MVTLVADKLKR